jgi:hypothetical protein
MQHKISNMPATDSHMNIVTPISPEGTVVRLVPLSREHVELFWDAAKDARGFPENGRKDAG